MGIVYLLSVLILLTVFILFKKSEKRFDITSFICITIVVLFCYNTFICYVLTFFTIPITLTLLSIINILISISLFIYIFKKKEIQKFNFNKLDILYILLMLIIVLVISYINFGFPFNINYETGDPSAHFLTSRRFADSGKLLAASDGDKVYSKAFVRVRKTVSYVNSGLIMKSLSPDLDTIDCYNIFVVFGIFVWFLTGISMYAVMRKFSKKSEHIFIAFLLSTICMLGYPLNSFLFGFEYLSMGLLILCSIIDLITYYQKKELGFKTFILIMSLLNFGLFSAYYMFVPFVYPALWIYFCVENYRQNKKTITKKLIAILSITLLLPFILGFIYHLAPDIYSIIIDYRKELNNEISYPVSEEDTKLINYENEEAAKDVMDYSEFVLDTGLSTSGYIYINLYSNMLLLIPLAIYLFIKNLKQEDENKDNFICLLVICTFLFIGLLLIGNYYGKVSAYYLSKNYFALWIILWFVNYKSIILISENNKYISRLFIGTYVFLMIWCTAFSNVKLKYYIKNPFETPLSVMEIFGANKTILFEKPIEFNQEELEILKYAKDNLDYNLEIEVVEDEQPNYWAYVILDYINDEENVTKYHDQNKLNAKIYFLSSQINKVDYMIYFKKSVEYDKLKDRLFENSEIVFENESGGIIKYNK